jgi:chromosome segregation protein
MKRLRGNESTDVIFNGSACRAQAGAAEVTLTFDNSNRLFDLDTPEVHITRRIYRSGEGEYLINRQAVRLKDIKDILSGTGLGTQAYSIIEQGRVESLLNSSSVQRRIIFEEAAGISRFNARKQEIARRYERIEQNLLRLGDKVADLDNQLKNTRSQAGKAQLYKQYADQLQEYRIQAALLNYRQNAVCTEGLKRQEYELSENIRQLTEIVSENEKTLTLFNEEIETGEKKIKSIENGLAAIREKIVSEESGIEVQTEQSEELENEITLNGMQLLELNGKSIDIEDAAQKTAEDIRAAKVSKEEITQTYRQLQKRGEELALLLNSRKEELNAVQKEKEGKNKQNAKLAGSINGAGLRLTTLEQSREQNVVRIERFRLQNEELRQQHSELQTVAEQMEKSAAQRQEQLTAVKLSKSSRARELAALQQDLSELKQRQSGIRERTAVLEELIRKNEGLNPGVKDVLQQSRDPKSPFRYVFGLVADLIRVEVDAASLIEIALGANAQYVVVSPKPELFRHIEQNSVQFSGRVGFIWLDPTEKEAPWVKAKGFTDRPGVLGRADRFVKVDAQFAHLASRLLGRTWIVENLAVARKLYKESDDRTNFLTVSGEMLTPDGALIVGPANTSTGLITRRSELRTLEEQMKFLDTDVAEAESAVAAAKERAAHDEINVETETREHQKAITEFNTQKQKLTSVLEKLQHGEEQEKHLSGELEKLNLQIVRAEEEILQAKKTKEQFDSEITALELQHIEINQLLEGIEEDFAEHRNKTNDVKIELAKSEERLAFLNERAAQYEKQIQERKRILKESQRRNISFIERRDAVQLAVLKSESALASLYLKKEKFAAQILTEQQCRNELTAKRNKLLSENKKRQNELLKLQNKIHSVQIESEHYQHLQKTLTDRISEDYKINLTELYAGNNSIVPAESGTEVPDYQKEIENIRSKISRLGNVNMDAVETLEELEKQYNILNKQYTDFVSAKKLNEKIIEKLNADCRIVLEETFNGVREHFCSLFQRLFGGGTADLILENPENILESGIEIIAMPPGKELKNVSLLSGGEKTMTCVALLLAFLEYRPNPVCILDECDAALDEGNVDRFVRVIKEFGTKTQFLMITHSKKSMASASTIYGITMQESGISKPISVRFAEVDENGNIISINESKDYKKTA